ncbi:hypothetical protein F5Y15DRAFT_303771 [Xylariaceae sp. FL0016]|nr:hypothetical protein F5Y15DRAFT_303771 [Xylariaceae sp. FL0016]
MSNWTVSITPGPSSQPSSQPSSTPVPVPNLMAASGPPYRSDQAILGGVATPEIDDPISAVLLFLFLASAAAHMTILQLNKRAGLKFLFSGMLFALCTLRSIALAMRIVWASYETNINIAIAANILTQAGSVLVFVINLFFSQRIVRAYHPTFGWHQVTRIVFRFLVACVVCSLIMVIAVTVQSFFTLDPSTRRSDRDVQLFAGTYLAVLAFLPIPVVILAMFFPRKTHIDKFGAGRWRSKLALLLFTACVATLGASFRIGTNFVPRPMNDPAWYHSRACYYCFNYVTDLTISTAYLLARFDRRFVVPDKSRGYGDYSKRTLHPPTDSGSDEKPHGKKAAKGGKDVDTEKDAKFRKRATGLSEHTVVNAEADVYGPDGSSSDWDAGRDPTSLTTWTPGDATDVDASVDGAECPGALFEMIDKMTDSSRDGSLELGLRPPAAAHLLADTAGRDGTDGAPEPTVPRSPLTALSPLSAVTLVGETNWPFDNSRSSTSSRPERERARSVHSG